MKSQPKENYMQSQPTVTVPWKVRECSIKNVIYMFSAKHVPRAHGIAN